MSRPASTKTCTDAREFENTDPIDHMLVVLDLLTPRRGDRTSRELVRRFDDGPYVELLHHYEFYVGTPYRYLVTDRIADALLALGYVDGKPAWGYRDMKVLRVTEAGEAHLARERERLGLSDRLRASLWYRLVREDVNHG